MKNKIIHPIIEPEHLKAAMRAWITGVAIVTGHHNGVVHGMTANSFNSIALNPPTVMVGLQLHTRTQHLVREGGVFAVTILGIEQLSLAKRFAGQINTDLDRFVGVDTFSMISGAPLIQNGIAFFDCKVSNILDVGGTALYLGEVLAVQNTRGERQPLLYFDRAWRKLAK